MYTVRFFCFNADLLKFLRIKMCHLHTNKPNSNKPTKYKQTNQIQTNKPNTNKQTKYKQTNQIQTNKPNTNQIQTN